MMLSIRCVHSLNINTLPHFLPSQSSHWWTNFFFLLTPIHCFGANWENLMNHPGITLCLDVNIQIGFCSSWIVGSIWLQIIGKQFKQQVDMKINVDWDWKDKRRRECSCITSLARQEDVLCWIMHSFCICVFWKMLINFLRVYFLSFVLCLQMFCEKFIIFLTNI